MSGCLPVDYWKMVGLPIAISKVPVGNAGGIAGSGRDANGGDRRFFDKTESH
jgi:hypothetical protein